MKLRDHDILAGAVVAWLIFGRRAAPKAATSAPTRATPASSPTAPASPRHARIYKGPDDAFDTVRMSVDLQDGKGFREMGIFSSPANARAQAKKSGWVIDSDVKGDDQ